MAGKVEAVRQALALKASLEAVSVKNEVTFVLST